MERYVSYQIQKFRGVVRGRAEELPDPITKYITRARTICDLSFRQLFLSCLWSYKGVHSWSSSWLKCFTVKLSGSYPRRVALRICVRLDATLWSFQGGIRRSFECQWCIFCDYAEDVELTHREQSARFKIGSRYLQQLLASPVHPKTKSLEGSLHSWWWLWDRPWHFHFFIKARASVQRPPLQSSCSTKAQTNNLYKANRASFADRSKEVTSVWHRSSRSLSPQRCTKVCQNDREVGWRKRWQGEC